MIEEKPQRKRWKITYSIKKDGIFLQYRTITGDTLNQLLEKIVKDVELVKEEMNAGE